MVRHTNGNKQISTKKNKQKEAKNPKPKWDTKKKRNTGGEKPKMAGYKRSGKGQVMTRSLGRMVGLLLSLYVFDQVLDAVMPTVNTSTYFATAVSFIDTLFPVVGILGAFEIIYSALRGAKLV